MVDVNKENIPLVSPRNFKTRWSPRLNAGICDKLCAAILLLLLGAREVDVRCGPQHLRVAPGVVDASPLWLARWRFEASVGRCRLRGRSVVDSARGSHHGRASRGGNPDKRWVRACLGVHDVGLSPPRRRDWWWPLNRRRRRRRMLCHYLVSMHASMSTCTNIIQAYIKSRSWTPTKRKREEE
jgi:hypothetical protein